MPLPVCTVRFVVIDPSDRARLACIVERDGLSLTVEEGGALRTTTAAAGDALSLRFVGEALEAWLRDPRNVLRAKNAITP